MRKSSLLIAIALVLVVVMVSPRFVPKARADPNVTAGYDLFETIAPTSFTFEDNCTTIPGNFFDPGSLPFGTNPGSLPFGQNVPFQGVPLGSFMGFPTGTTDTIVQRLADAILPPPPSTAPPVPIELVALSLVSVSPITVTFMDGSSQLWSIRAAVSTTTPSTGSITISQSDPTGGTFTSSLTVFPLFTFTRLSDGAVRTLDTGPFLAGTTCVPLITLSPTTPLPWLYSAPTPAILVVPGLSSNFCASCTLLFSQCAAMFPQFSHQCQEGKSPGSELAMLAQHGILPGQPPPTTVPEFPFGTVFALAMAPLLIVGIRFSTRRKIARHQQPNPHLAAPRR